MSKSVLLCLGLGFSASDLTRHLDRREWTIRAASRNSGRISGRIRSALPARHFFPFQSRAMWRNVTHLLISAPPNEKGDPVLARHRRSIARCPSLRWIGYLSSTGVYGDHGGAMVDEKTRARPSLVRSRRRLRAEKQWLHRFAGHRNPCLHIFRLAGIYGVGRSAIDSVLSRRARRIDMPNHVFSRIHVADITGALKASIRQAKNHNVHRHRIYNLCDDHPAPGHMVVDFACALLGADKPPLLSVDQAGLSPMARSFYQDRRRIANHRAKRELGWTPRYKNYRLGLRAVLADRGGISSRR